MGVMALAAGAAISGLVTVRYLTTRKTSASELLAEALLDTSRLEDASRNLAGSSESALASCASYFLGVSYRAAEGLGMAKGQYDPVGFNRTKAHSFTLAHAAVITEAHAPRHILTYSVIVPEVGEMHGTRTIGSLQIEGIFPAYSSPDTAQITLLNGYTAQLETDFRSTDSFLSGSTRLIGSAALRDNHGNIGRLNVSAEGNITGTITRDSRIVGRFNGTILSGIRFNPIKSLPQIDEIN